MSDFIHVEDLLRHIFARLPVATVADIQLVSREWRRVVRSPPLGRELFDLEQAHSQAVLIVTSTEFRAMYISNLLQNGDGDGVRAYIREFPTIRVTALIGSCEGLVCLTDCLHHLFVLNPRTLRIRQIIANTEPDDDGGPEYCLRAWSFGFGWKVHGAMRCHIVLRVIDGGFKCFKIFNLTQNRWTKHTFKSDCRNWSCRIDGGATSAFADGHFLWLGSVTAAAGLSMSIPSVIIYDTAQETFRHLPLLPEMFGFSLTIGNIGDNVIGIWGRDTDLTCFWRLDHTNGLYRQVNVTAYPSGIHFQPLSDPARYGMIVLQQHQRLDLYDPLRRRRTDIHIQTNLPWVLNHFTNEEFCMAILFSPSLISPGESQVLDNVRLEDDSGQLAPGQLEERQSDARRKDKGKGKGCLKCGALDHIAKECTGDSANNKKPHKYMLKNANGQHGGGNNSRHEMVLYGESRRQQRRDQEKRADDAETREDRGYSKKSADEDKSNKGKSSRHGRSSRSGGRGRERDTEDRLHQRESGKRSADSDREEHNERRRDIYLSEDYYRKRTTHGDRTTERSKDGQHRNRSAAPSEKRADGHAEHDRDAEMREDRGYMKKSVDEDKSNKRDEPKSSTGKD